MMKLIEIVATIFLLYLFLTAGAQEQKYKKQEENGNQRIMNRHVNMSIQTKDGDIFDCIDINRQPALDHPLLKNHVLQMKPSSYPLGFHDKSSSTANTTLLQLPTVACPVGTIPILRNSISTELVAPLSFYTSDVNFEGQLAGVFTEGELYGMRVTMNIYEPVVKGKEDSSASWSLVMNGPSWSIEGVSVGSIVSKMFNGDDFARFHIHWIDSHRQDCFDFRCAGFVQIGQGIAIGGRITPVSIYNGAQYELNFLIYQDPRTKDWWLMYNQTPVGYWPTALFTYMKDKAETAVFGGYVYGPTIISESPEMGSGHFAIEGEGKAAHVRNIKIVDKDNQFAEVDFENTFIASNVPTCYSVYELSHNSGGMATYYGGPGCKT